MTEKTRGCLFFMMMSILTLPVFAGASWKELCDGKTLNGWVQRGGQAKYAVRDGAIVGTTALNTPNSFLCTKQFYTDFIQQLCGV
jgi:hypothetical protein